MLIRVKKTGEILKFPEDSKIDIEVSWDKGEKTFSCDDVEILQIGGMPIDWEQRRYEIAKELYPLFLKWSSRRQTTQTIACKSVRYADALIEELKNKPL